MVGRGRLPEAAALAAAMGEEHGAVGDEDKYKVKTFGIGQIRQDSTHPEWIRTSFGIPVFQIFPDQIRTHSEQRPELSEPCISCPESQ